MAVFCVLSLTNTTLAEGTMVDRKDPLPTGASFHQPGVHASDVLKPESILCFIDSNVGISYLLMLSCAALTSYYIQIQQLWSVPRPQRLIIY